MGYHFNVKFVSRAKGESLIAKGAYQARDKFTEERTAEIKDYTHASDRPKATMVFSHKAQQEKHGGAEALLNAIDKAERRKDAQTGLNFIAALPAQLTDEERNRMVRDFGREEFLRKDIPAIVQVHPPSEHGDDRNEHLHILAGTRKLNGDGFAKEKHITWDNYSRHLEIWREKWAELGARYLEKAGYQIEADRWRYGHLKNEIQRDKAIERGDLEFADLKDQEATQHRGPAVDAMQAKGVETERGNAYRDTVASNAQRADELAALKSQLAEVEHQIALTQAAGEQWRSSSLETERQFQVAGRDVAQPKPEITAPDEIRDSAPRQIWEAYQRSDNMKSFTAALQENGMMLAGATKEDVRASEIDNQEAKQAGKFSPILREGQIVIVTDRAQVYTLTPRTTGDDWRDIQKFTASLDPKTLESVGAARETMQHYAEMRDLQRQAFRDVTGAPTIKGPSGKSPLAEVDKGLSAGIRTGKKAVETARGDVAAAKTVVQKPASTAEAVLGKFLNSIETMGDALTPEESKAEGKALDAAAAQAEINWKRFAADKDYREFVQRRETEQRAKDLERERENERDARQR
jgi:hypothetical protein